MDFLSDKIDEAFTEPISRDRVSMEETIVTEKFDFMKRLFGKKKTAKPDKEMQSIEQDYEEYGIEDADEEPVEKTRTANSPTVHVKSYAIARGKGSIRVAVDGDKSTTKARLHIFKKGERYFGFLAIPGPGRKAGTKVESFEQEMRLLLDTVIYEAAADIVLKYDSNNLEDLFNLGNYKQRSSLESSKFDEYEQQVDMLDKDTAQKANLGSLPWGKQRRAEVSGEEVTEVDTTAAKALADKYENEYDSLNIDNDPFLKMLYGNAADILASIKSKQEIEFVIAKMDKSIKNYTKKGDEESQSKIESIEGVKQDFLSVLEGID